jgi:hypothetical protein
MTIIQKLSDRDSLIYEAIKMVLVNMEPMPLQKIQWELFKCGVYIKAPLLAEAMKTMQEKGLLTRPEPKPKIALPKIIMP